MDLLTSLLALSSIVLTCVLVLTSNSRARKLPPGPYPFPIIGNILALGPKPHQSLAKLSKTYGPLMSIQLGSMTTIVVSSPEMAKAVFQTNDLAFSSRTVPSSVTTLDHDKFSMIWMPADSQWRKLRKICKEQMFSAASLDGSRELRKENMEKLLDYVKECSGKGAVVDIGRAAFLTSLNLISVTLFSREIAKFDSDSLPEMKEVVWGVVNGFGGPNLSDYFPVLQWFDPQGIVKETKFNLEKLYAVFDEIIDEKLKSRGKGEKREEGDNDMVEALLDLSLKDEPEISRNEINHLLLDLFVAGTDTASIVVEWTMSELLRHPEKMSRVRNETKNVVGENEQVQESDISKLPFLQAVVKEALRLHPPGPFLVPRKAASDIEINGYVIPRNAQVLVNVWATGRDPNIWPNADSFMPERFLDDKSVDFRGNNFELIPFGAGRRICPGLPLANRMVYLMLATFIHNFSWTLENGETPQQIDMPEIFELTLRRATPLKAIPVELSLCPIT